MLAGVARFPFEALPAISRDEIEASRRLLAAAGLARMDGIATALAELVEAPVSIVVRRTQKLDPTRIPADALGVVVADAASLAPAGKERGTGASPSYTRVALVDVEPALATTLVARALRQRAPRIVDASRGPRPEITGSLAALLSATLRRSHAGIALRVLAAGPAQALARDLGQASRGATANTASDRILTAWLTVLVGADAFDARVSLPLDAIPPAGHRAFESNDLVALGDLPLALPLVASTCLALRHDLAVLHSGDAFMVPRFPLKADGESGALIGPVTLLPATAERGIAGDLAKDERLVLRTERVESHPWDAPAPTTRNSESRRRDNNDLAATTMSSASSDGQSMNATLEVLEDAPVVVRVELGVVEMKARDWASIATGDVVTLGRRLGDPAILRVAGVEVARGEIVQVDGEYGVRILRRAGGIP